MFNFIIGFILGIAASTIGFTTIAGYADQGVQKIQQTVKDAQ